MPYITASPERQLSGKFVRLNGHFIPQGRVRVPYATLPARLLGLSGKFVNQRIMRPPYRSMAGMGQTTAVIPTAAADRLRALCATRPELCARLCSQYPMANAFFRSACSPPALSGMGQDETAPNGSVEPGLFDTAMTWMKDNPLLAGGIAVGAVLLFAGRR